MKIILSAFGHKMMSGPIDVPENTSPTWDMVLTQPVSIKSGFSGEKLGELPSLLTRCRFEWTGKILDGARFYVLTDISKI